MYRVQTDTATQRARGSLLRCTWLHYSRSTVLTREMCLNGKYRTSDSGRLRVSNLSKGLGWDFPKPMGGSVAAQAHGRLWLSGCGPGARGGRPRVSGERHRGGRVAVINRHPRGVLRVCTQPVRALSPLC